LKTNSSGSSRSGRPTICQAVMSHLSRLNQTRSLICSQGITWTSMSSPIAFICCAASWIPSNSSGTFACGCTASDSLRTRRGSACAAAAAPGTATPSEAATAAPPPSAAARRSTSRRESSPAAYRSTSRASA
jgi:hypothetical protein